MKQFAIIALLGVAQSIVVKSKDSDDYLGSYTTKYGRSTYDVTSDEYKATVWNKENPHPGYDAAHHEFEGVEGKGEYSRATPDNFQGPGSGDDQFMFSMIRNYALEEAAEDGKKTGKFIFGYNQAKLAS